MAEAMELDLTLKIVDETLKSHCPPNLDKNNEISDKIDIQLKHIMVMMTLELMY